MKNIVNKIIDYAKANTKLFSLYSVLGVLLIVLVIGLVSRWGVENSGSTTKVNSNTKEVYKDIDDLEVQQDKISEINTLITNYYTALVAGDVTTLSTLVDDSADVNQNQIEKGIVESFNNISCYTVKGLEEDTLVGFVYWEVKFVNTETLAPGIDTFYFIKDDDTNSYIIKTISDGEKSYINTITQNEQIKALFEDTNNKFNTAVNSDEQLKKVYNYFVENASQTKESEETTTTATETTTTAPTQ